MTKNPLAIAAKAKGPFAALKRAKVIVQRYGLTPAKLNYALEIFTHTLQKFNCGATLPLTAVTLERHQGSIAGLLDRNIDWAVHGYTHVDCANLDAEQITAQLQRARRAFELAGIPVAGYRSPYLRRVPHLNAAIEKAGFSYVSNQPILWPALDILKLPPGGRAGYDRAIDFYEPLDPKNHLSLPWLAGSLVEIPVSLPDDEMLLDRLQVAGQGLVEEAWSHILLETHRRGELFTIQLHPERIELCADALSAILSRARALTPPVWVARLDEIAAWWRARAAARIQLEDQSGGTWRVTVDGPPGTKVLLRGVQGPEHAKPWAGRTWMVESPTCLIKSDTAPLVGLSPRSSPAVAAFLHQSGYVCEVIDSGPLPPIYVDRPLFGPEDERPLLRELDSGSTPLVRLGRWPGGTQSALCISGDVDALTIWDYFLRALGR